VVGGDVGDQAPCVVAVAGGDDDRAGDVLVGVEGGFDLAEFDTEAVDFDLEVLAAEEFQVAVG
jgi:hypothetical protein